MDSKIKIALELQKEQAQAQLNDFEQKAKAQLERLQKAQARFAANPTAFNRNTLAATARGYNNSLNNIQGAQGRLENLQLKIDKEDARKGGRLFGIAVNKQTEAFAKQFLGAYIGRELMNIGFAAAYQVGGNNAGLRTAQEATESAATGMQIGAAFGPLGAAVGAVTGGLIGLATASIKLQKAIQQEQLERSNENYRFNRDTGRALQNKSFDRLVEQNLRGGQIKMLKERYAEVSGQRNAPELKDLDKKIEDMEKRRNAAIRNGENTMPYDAALRSYYTRRHNLSDGTSLDLKSLKAELGFKENVEKDVESNEYKILKENYSRALGEMGSLSERLMDASMKTTLGFQTMGTYNDSLAKQGIYVGGGNSDYEGVMNVEEVNRSTLEEVKMIRKIAERLALTGDKNLSAGKGLDIALEASARFGL